MDINDLKGISTVFVMIAFLGVCWWAYSPSRKKQFEEAANAPFADEVDPQATPVEPEGDNEKGQEKL